MQKIKTFTSADACYFTPVAPANPYFLLFSAEAGWRLDGIYNQHELSLGGDLDGSAATISVLPPGSDEWKELVTGKGLDDQILLTGTARGIKVEFVGGGGSPDPTLTLISRMRGL